MQMFESGFARILFKQMFWLSARYSQLKYNLLVPKHARWWEGMVLLIHFWKESLGVDFEICFHRF